MSSEQVLPAGGANLPAGDICKVENALVKPFDRRSRPGSTGPYCGVFDVANQPAPHGGLATTRWTSDLNTEIAAKARERAGRLEGEWIFGGLARNHFGHVISNALGRLWAVDHAPAGTPVLYAGHMVPRGDRQNRFVQGMFDLFGIDVPHRVCPASMAVESLIVPPDLFGEGSEGRADPAYVAWLKDRLTVAPMGGEKLYITRARLDPMLGRILCEDVLERNFEAAGFDIMSPELLSLEEQAARYRAARVIVTTEGSAIHLAALCMHPEARLFIVLRRPNLHYLIANQLSTFTPGQWEQVDFITEQWWRPERADNRGMAEVDFAALRDRLADLGALPAFSDWKIPDAGAIEASKHDGIPAGTQILSHAEHGTFKRQRAQKRAAGLIRRGAATGD